MSTAFKNGGRCRVMKLEPLCFSPPVSSYMVSQRLTTFKNNYLMRWVNVWLFLSAPTCSIKQPLCNSFYSLRTSSGGVTSTLVLHPLDLIKIRFQGKILGITWLRVTCKCLSNRKRFPCLRSLSVYIRLCKHRKKVFYCSFTWDQALFSFRFENYIPAGKTKRKESLIQTFNEMSAAHFFDWLTFAESANQNYFRYLFF